MSLTTEFNAISTIQNIAPNVFNTMATLAVAPGTGATFDNDRVSGTIGIAGDTVTGAVYVHLPSALAQQIVNAMLGNPAGQPVEDGDLNDVVGELTNMIGGGFKSALCDAGRPCAMSTPSIIRGAYAIEVPHDLLVETAHFVCEKFSFAIEVHTRFD